MDVKKELLVKLYETVGYKKAPTWNDAKLVSYLPKLQEVAQEDVPTDKKELKLYKAILLALGKGEEISLAGAEAPVADETPKKNGKPKAEKEEAVGEKVRKKAEPSRPGIIQAIADIMKGTSKKNALTHREVLDQLVEKFPDRSRDAMAKTLSGQIPTGLMRTRGMQIGWEKEPKMPKKYFFQKPAKAKADA